MIVNETVYDNLELDPSVDAVLYGLDSEFTHQKMCLASLYIQERKVPLIASNQDKNALIAGKYFPGTGSML